MSTAQPTSDTTPLSRNRRTAPRTTTPLTTVDTGIYLLALGGFYVSYQTLRTLARASGYPADQATVVAALADLAILLYSRKAVHEVEQGRSAWGIRLIVTALSLATVSLQLRTAWPHPTALGLHALPAAVWITGLEMMLRGKLRDAKAARRRALTAAGLRPAPLQRLRTAEWLMAPVPVFKVWRMMILLGVPADTARTHLAASWTNATAVPASWTVTTPPPAAQDPQDTKLALVPTPVTALRADGHEATEAELAVFIADLPDVPPPGRTKDEARQYLAAVDAAAARHELTVTGACASRLLGVSPSYISQIRIRKTSELTAATS